jgi:hypothetical protein
MNTDRARISILARGGRVGGSLLRSEPGTEIENRVAADPVGPVIAR